MAHREKNRAGYRKGGVQGSQSIVIGVEDVETPPNENRITNNSIKETAEAVEIKEEKAGEDVDSDKNSKEEPPNHSLQN